MKNLPKLFRQGDVLIERVECIPNNAVAVQSDNERIVLAHGEATGHAHTLSQKGAKLKQVPGETATYLEIAEALAEVHHQEHATVSLQRGQWRVTRQREYGPEAIRNVAD